MLGDFTNSTAIVPYGQNPTGQIVGNASNFDFPPPQTRSISPYGSGYRPPPRTSIVPYGSGYKPKDPGPASKRPGIAGYALFVGMGMMGEEKTVYGQAKGFVRGNLDYAGWELGAKAGTKLFGKTALSRSGTMMASVARGGASMLGGTIGMAVTGTAMYGWDRWEKGVEKERKLRELNWVGNTAAFNTQRSHTMRQTSLEAMNRGMMSARSMLGREGAMLHQ